MKMPAKERKRLCKAAADKKGVFQRKLASKFRIDHRYVGRILVESGVKYHKRQRCPNWNPEQEPRHKTRCRKMVMEFCKPSSGIELVIDDESYFPLKHDENNSNAVFYSGDKKNTSHSEMQV